MDPFLVAQKSAFGLLLALCQEKPEKHSNCRDYISSHLEPACSEEWREIQLPRFLQVIAPPS